MTVDEVDEVDDFQSLYFLPLPSRVQATRLLVQVEGSAKIWKWWIIDFIDFTADRERQSGRLVLRLLSRLAMPRPGDPDLPSETPGRGRRKSGTIDQQPALDSSASPRNLNFEGGPMPRPRVPLEILVHRGPNPGKRPPGASPIREGGSKVGAVSQRPGVGCFLHKA